MCQHTSAYASIRQHTSACVSIRQHTSAYASIRQHTLLLAWERRARFSSRTERLLCSSSNPAPLCKKNSVFLKKGLSAEPLTPRRSCRQGKKNASIRQHTSANASIRQHTPAYASIRQHTPAYVSIRQPALLLQPAVRLRLCCSSVAALLQLYCSGSIPAPLLQPAVRLRRC
jgi:hypothetical protein